VNSKSGRHNERIRKMKRAGLDRFGRPLPRTIGFNLGERPVVGDFHFKVAHYRTPVSLDRSRAFTIPLAKLELAQGADR
jgi:hypothetical protein